MPQTFFQQIDYAQRLHKLRLLLLKMACDAFIFEYPIDLFYLTGLELSAGQLVITQQACCLFVDGRYTEYSSKQTLYPVLFNSKQNIITWLGDHTIRCLGFDQNHTSYQKFFTLTELFGTALSTLKLMPLESPLIELRMIKEEGEIESLKKAAHLGNQGFHYIQSLIKEGISEQQLAIELEIFWKKAGAQRLAFESIIAFGPNGSMPHYRSGDSTFSTNSAVLIDCGVVVDFYHSDMTRVLFFGQVSPIIHTIYSIVEEAKERVFQQCRPGTLIGELDQIARDWISSKGYGEYFTHSLGHGVGLEIHEAPLIKRDNDFSQKPLQKGMVITIEPGIYLPNSGGVRLEDTIVITEYGYENITQSQPI